jgi:hypothetical protein
MKLTNILAGLQQNDGTKTAGEKAPSQGETKVAAPATTTGLQAALVAAVSAAPATKTAAESAPLSTPVSDVVKVAAEIAAHEKDLMKKEAEEFGAAFADAAMSRVAQWQAKIAAPVASPAPAVAAPASPDVSMFGKFAKTAMAKQAFDLSYKNTKAAVEKLAAESKQQGFNETVDRIHKVASVEFIKGAEQTSAILMALSAR